MLRPTVLALLWAAAAAGQGFEVASIKPSQPNSARLTNDPLTFSAPGTTLKLLLAQAYDVFPDQVSGGPEWTFSDRFDIVAKAAGRLRKGRCQIPRL
jgi:uncharacterized protein (TIGR03435 family)